MTCVHRDVFGYCRIYSDLDVDVICPGNRECDRYVERDRIVHILGSAYTIKEQSVDDNHLLENCDGYCDWTTKEIVIEREFTGTLGDMEAYIRKVIRHEIVHAFLFESGLSESAAASSGAWPLNEEMIDWFARQGPKIYEAWKEAGALDEK